MKLVIHNGATDDLVDNSSLSVSYLNAKFTGDSWANTESNAIGWSYHDGAR